MARAQRIATEAQIRPVFQKPGPFLNQPTLTLDTGTIQGTTRTLDVRPPVGQIWEVLFAAGQLSAVSSPSAGSAARVQITIRTGTTNYLVAEDNLVAGDGQTYDDVHVELTSLGGPFLITNSKYLRMIGTSDSTTGAQVVDFIIVTVPV